MIEHDRKKADAETPVAESIARRWSPYLFSDRPVHAEDLRALFEAARWAASSYNEQPWRYIVATRNDPEGFERMLSCLVEANREWAKNAPVVCLGIVRRRFRRNEKPNRAAAHDLGLASGNLSVEATRRGIAVHQMAGIDPERAREVYEIPEGYDAFTALAIGYPDLASDEPEKLRQRDDTPRSRRPVEKFVFGGAWGEAFFGA